jgi:hypothetical protein
LFTFSTYEFTDHIGIGEHATPKNRGPSDDTKYKMATFLKMALWFYEVSVTYGYHLPK